MCVIVTIIHSEQIQMFFYETRKICQVPSPRGPEQILETELQELPNA